MKVFDSHMHWRDPVNNTYELLSDGVSEDGERGGSQAAVYLPEDYLLDAGDVEITGVIHVEAEWNKAEPVGETRWLDDLYAGNRLQGLNIGIVGFADLANANVEATLEQHARYSLVRGVRQMLNYLPGRPAYCWAERQYLDDPLWRQNFGLLSKYGLDFDLMCFAHQMPAMARLAARHPDVRIHLEHTGMPWDHSAEGRAQWREGLKLIAGLDNSDIKISGLGNTIDDWTEDKIRPYVLEAIDIFGPDRTCFASNFPTDKKFSDMPAIWIAFDRILGGFDETTRTAMFESNGPKFYRLI